MTLPADAHVHSEWSWDTGGPQSDAAGTMERTCRRAVEIGLPAVVFTEHLDFDGWLIDREDVLDHQETLLVEDSVLRPPPLDAEGYLESIHRCRQQFPELRILTGVEYGQPHLFDQRVSEVVDIGMLDRVNGSLHTVADGDHRSEPFTLFRRWPADDVVRAYLEEVPRMVAGSDTFEVFTHIDYAVRFWPVETEGPFDPTRFEEGFRAAMRALADADRGLELNTRRLWSWIPQWWVEEGGRAISFGSDAHTSEELAAQLPEAAVMAEHFGFRPGSRPEDLWRR